MGKGSEFPPSGISGIGRKGNRLFITVLGVCLTHERWLLVVCLKLSRIVSNMLASPLFAVCTEIHLVGKAVVLHL